MWIKGFSDFALILFEQLPLPFSISKNPFYTPESNFHRNFPKYRCRKILEPNLHTMQWTEMFGKSQSHFPRFDGKSVKSKVGTFAGAEQWDPVSQALDSLPSSCLHSQMKLTLWGPPSLCHSVISLHNAIKKAKNNNRKSNRKRFSLRLTAHEKKEGKTTRQRSRSKSKKINKSM